MGYNQRYKSINLCPEPCTGGGTWGRWLNIQHGEISPILITDVATPLLVQAINSTIQSPGGQWTLRGQFTVSDDIGGGSLLALVFDFGGLNTYTAELDIPDGESPNMVEFEIKVDDFEDSSRLTRLILWVRGRTPGTEPVEISMPTLPFGPTPQPDFNLTISGVASGSDLTFTWNGLLGENFTVPAA